MTVLRYVVEIDSEDTRPDVADRVADELARALLHRFAAVQVVTISEVPADA